MDNELASTQTVDQAQADSSYGCLTAFLAVVVFSLVGLMGFFWIGTLLEDLFGKSLAFDLGRAIGYSLLLVIPFGLIAVLLRQERFALWRGIALTLALAGGHAGLLGALLAIDRSMTWPGLPAWLPPLVSILYSLAIIVAGRRHFLGKPAGGPLLLGLGLGLLVSASWLVGGALGTLVETSIGVLDAFSIALICAVLLATLFFYDRQMPARAPVASIFLVGAAFWALEYGVLAVRGYWLQGSLLGTGLFPLGLIAGGHLTLDEEPDTSRLWWAMLALFFAAFLLPFTWGEGLEGDYMFEEMAVAWGPTVLAMLLTSLVLGVLMLIVRRWLVRLVSMPAIPAVFDTGVLAVCALLFVGFGKPAMQPETFFVVMTEQADTSFARDIADRDERVSAVYEALIEQAAGSQADLRAMLDARGAAYTPYYLVNGLEVTGDPLLRVQIAARPDVARVLASPHTRPLPSWATEISMPSMVDHPSDLSWGVDQMDAEKVWEQYDITGEGIIVGGADTGIDWTHPALRSRYLGSEGNHDYTWFDAWEGAAEPVDGMGHGTHTMGIVLGQDGIGVAPGARWIGCRNMKRSMANPAYYLDCMQFLFAPHPQEGDPFADGDPTRGAHVVNNSWGCPPEEGCDAITLSIGLEHVRNAGQMYIVSAGNEGPACDTVGPPANADAAFSVGAVDESGTITSFSSRGPVLIDGSGRIKPDVAAPGDFILSSVPGGGYGSASGTSMAGPHVTGLVALLWSADPSLIGDIDRTEEIIRDTAHYVPAPDLCGGDTGDVNNAYGYGWVDAFAAVTEVIE